MRIEVDIEATDREHAEKRMNLLCGDIEGRTWVTAVLPDGIEERIRMRPGKDTP